MVIYDIVDLSIEHGDVSIINYVSLPESNVHLSNKHAEKRQEHVDLVTQTTLETWIPQSKKRNIGNTEDCAHALCFISVAVLVYGFQGWNHQFGDMLRCLLYHV